MKLEEIIVQSAVSGLALQMDSGAMLPGRNGPHNHRMTPARNTGHWAITFLEAFKVSENSGFRDAAVRCLDYLLSDELRPFGDLIWHRNHPGVSRTNGLIGQAWSMEALICGWKELELSRYRQAARRLVNAHKFDKESGLWYSMDLQSSPLRIERTLNQQLWFTAMTAVYFSLAGTGPDERVLLFLDNLGRAAQVATSHRLPLVTAVSGRRHKIYERKFKNAVMVLLNTRDYRLKEIGYHVFSLCAVAQLASLLPEHRIWSTPVFKRAVRHAVSEAYLRSLEGNPYGYPYNVPGFEIPFIYEKLAKFYPEMKEELAEASGFSLRRQLERHFDGEKSVLCRNTEDPDTLSARLYELTRLSLGNWKVDMAGGGSDIRK